MDELILKVLSGSATRFEEERLKRWRREDPEHEARARTLARIWQATQPESTQGPGPEDVESLAASIMSTAESRRAAASRRASGKLARRRFIKLVRPAAALAAGVAALALGIQAFGPRAGDPSEPQPPISIALSSRTLRLDDGSFVRLAPGSHLEARLEADLREVTLDGQAFFAVAPDPSRPFVVKSGDSRIRVLGTRFEVSEVEDEVRTVVVEGRVALTNSSGQVEVPAGSVGRAPRRGPPVAEPAEDVLSLLEWPGGLLVFHDTPLRTVSREVERHFGLPIRLAGDDSLGHSVSASFEEGESFKEVMETLCAVTGARCRIFPDSATIGGTEGGVR